MKYVYVAAPITLGNQIHNIKVAVNAGETLRRAGFVPFVPHALMIWDFISSLSYEDWMEFDFAWIQKCDLLLRLPGDSSGADREVEYARKLEKPVFFSLYDVLNLK